LVHERIACYHARIPADSSAPAPQDIDPLIERCLKGDQRAWDEIVHLFRRKVFNIAYKFVGRHDEAEDLTQDIFLKLFKSLKTFDRRANFSTWLISVSRNLCIDHYRSMRREHDVVTHDVDVVSLARPAVIDSPQVALEQRDRVALLRTALDRLAPSLRNAVMLRDIQELSYQEIAEKLGVPEGTVKSRINRGRTELSRQIVRLREQQETARAKGARRAPARPRTGAAR
jgi:RNA polymerase sigma factor (sigma-70 family)